MFLRYMCYALYAAFACGGIYSNHSVAVCTAAFDGSILYNQSLLRLLGVHVWRGGANLCNLHPSI